MKTAICYYSVHHGNTRKLIEAMTQGYDVDLIPVTQRQAVCLDDYDLIGFASGIYGFEMHQSVVDFARQYLPEDKKIFIVYTYGAQKGKASDALKKIAAEKHADLVGEYACKGYDTFGPFKWVGGIAKGHPTDEELRQGRALFEEWLAKAQGA